MALTDELADHLRRAVPGLNDVTIGRVLLALGAFFTPTDADRRELTQGEIANVLVLAGIDLTVTEVHEI
jgi:hypothetical protein